jgi:hypothetical protein
VELAVTDRRQLGESSQAVKQSLVEAIDAALDLGDAARAEELVASIEEVPPGLRSPYLDAQGRRFRARLSAEEDVAEDAFRDAAARLRGLGVVFWLAVTLLEHGEWLLARGRPGEAGPLLAEAHEIFERLEAKPWLDRLAALETAPPAGIPA